MTTLTNTTLRYGWLAILLHWGMALLLALLLATGLYMVRLPDVGFDTDKITLILLHKAIGMLALGGAALRIAWRAGNALPQLAASLPEWQKVVARFVHLALYALMFAVPVTGWLMSSAGAFPVPFFGLFDVPDLIGPNEHLFHALIDLHRWLAYALLLLVLLHAGAALRHHLVLKDDTLEKMLPGA